MILLSYKDIWATLSNKTRFSIPPVLLRFSWDFEQKQEKSLLFQASPKQHLGIAFALKNLSREKIVFYMYLYV